MVGPLSYKVSLADKFVAEVGDVAAEVRRVFMALSSVTLLQEWAIEARLSVGEVESIESNACIVEIQDRTALVSRQISLFLKTRINTDETN